MDMFETKGYIAYSKDEINRRNSTSGGLFYEVASHVLQNGGVVYGAVFDDDFQVMHIRATELADVKRMRGSKYAQSSLGDVFRLVKADLDKGEAVLFSGTPCQVAGLKKYIRKNQGKLICLDFICLGVPSPGVWRDYLATFHSVKKIKKITFKDKKFGWSKWTFLIQCTDKVFREPGNINYYMQAYLKHLSIRPSCYECQFRTISHESDITIADCWGIEKIKPELNDEKGISTVLIHSAKGEEILLNVKDRIECIEVPVQELLKGNPYATQAIAYNPKRIRFFEDYNKKGIKYAMYKYTWRKNIFKQMKEILRWKKYSRKEFVKGNNTNE